MQKNYFVIVVCMKKIRLLIFAVVSIVFISCAKSNKLEKNGTPHSSSENFSHNTVIVSLKNGTSDEEIKKLAEKHNLKVLYNYKNFSMCALSSEKTLNDKELSTLISELKKEKIVLNVEKDYIMHIE